jgi:exonuclease SbcD
VRILHTSDWHLGRSFHREGMLGHQAAYVDHLVRVVEDEKVDLVVVAGDIYDRALPHVDAVRLADETLARLAASRAQVVLTSGNHDSAQRLGFSSRLIDAAGVFIRTDASGVGAPVLLEDAHGPVAVYGIPYLDPDSVREPWGLAARSHVAHAFVAGAQPSESERDISVGGVSLVPTTVFDGIDYTALGHLHGRHTLTDSIRYSGSPLAYSFSEAGHTKGSWLVDLGPHGLTTAEFIEAPVPRRLARIRGSLDDLLHDLTITEHEDAWVHATLTDATRPLQAMDRLRSRFPHTLVIAFEPVGGDRLRVPVARTQGRSDHAIALDFIAELRGTPATKAESALLQTAVDACCEDSDFDVLVSGGAP